MSKKKRYLFIGIVAMSLALSGCGNAMYELTAEEEELIVQYAAYVVAKHNIQQKDGASSVYIDEETLLSDTETEEEGTSTEETTIDGETPGEGEGTVSEDGVTLAAVIGHESDLSVSYEGSYVADNYVEGGAYSVDAASGKTFYVMKFKVTNVTNQVVSVNNASINPIFKLISGDVSVKSEVTFLTTDFSTYQGEIGAGESIETILLFEVSDASAETITAPTLSITIDNVTKNVKL